MTKKPTVSVSDTFASAYPEERKKQRNWVLACHQLEAWAIRTLGATCHTTKGAKKIAKAINPKLSYSAIKSWIGGWAPPTIPNQHRIAEICGISPKSWYIPADPLWVTRKNAPGIKRAKPTGGTREMGGSVPPIDPMAIRVAERFAQNTNATINTNRDRSEWGSGDNKLVAACTARMNQEQAEYERNVALAKSEGTTIKTPSRVLRERARGADPFDRTSITDTVEIEKFTSGPVKVPEIKEPELTLTDLLDKISILEAHVFSKRPRTTWNLDDGIEHHLGKAIDLEKRKKTWGKVG